MIQNIDVFSSSLSFSEDDIRDKTVVVIDVLRACSTIQTALENGAAGVIPVSESEDAGKYTQLLDASRLLLCGEKNGKKVDGFHLGNSPFEYAREVVENKTLIFKTSNGTRAITRSSHAREVLIGSLLNLSALVTYLENTDRSDVLLICSGWKSRLSIEDMLCAGAIIHKFYEQKLPENAMDGTKVAFGLYERFGNDMKNVLLTSNHAKRLQKLGYDKDIDYCSQVDLLTSVPSLIQGMITIR